MPKDYPRGRRVADQIQRELSEIIRMELKDPRVGLITITDVEVTQDNEHAKVFFTALGEPVQQEAAERALNHASGFLRSSLAKVMKLRTVPQLRFNYDVSVERGVRLSNLIDEAVASSMFESDQIFRRNCVIEVRVIDVGEHWATGSTTLVDHRIHIFLQHFGDAAATLRDHRFFEIHTVQVDWMLFEAIRYFHATNENELVFCFEEASKLIECF